VERLMMAVRGLVVPEFVTRLEIPLAISHCRIVRGI
jgi:hypothetical protein